MATPVSVIIATYYRNTLLRDAIESVLAQSYEPIELIVVDDSGEGYATPVLEDYVEVDAIVRADNGGWAAAYTTGIRAATGAYVQLLDDDDCLLEGKLARTAQVLDDSPDVGVAYCGLVQDTGARIVPNPAVRGDVREHAMRFRTLPCCTITMLTRRELLEELLPLADHADDLNLKIELAKRTRFDYVDDCLVYRRTRASRRWQGLRKIEEMKRTVAHHGDLYDRQPDVKRAVLAEIYAREGNERLKQRAWSFKAITCYLQSARYDTERRLPYGLFVAAWFGRPGVSLVKSLRERLARAA